MALVTLTLGEITFANFEIPNKINFGGAQALSVKQLIGGQRVIDAMGSIDDDISWSGLFFGSTATFRAQFLDGMRISGNNFNLQYSQFSYLVKIKSFKAEFERFFQIPYSITVTPIQDLNNPFPVLLPVTYNDAVQVQINEAIDLATAINNPSISNSIAILADTINSIPSLSNASALELATISAEITSTSSLVVNEINALNSGVF